jgi:capsular polysaccharide biosynthesis protein
MAVEGIDVSPALESGAYEVTNPIDLPHIEREEVISGTGEGIYVETESPEREFHRYGAAFVDDPDEVGLFAGKIGPGRYLYPPIYTAAVNNATLVGYRTILTEDRKFFTDEAYVEPHVYQHQLARISGSDHFSNERTGLRATGQERIFQFEPGGRAHRHIEGKALVLCSDEPQSYGSFLFRVVPKVRSVRDLGLINTPCIVYAQQKPFMDLLSFCGLPVASIIPHDMDAVTRIDRAIVPCMRNPHAYLDPESFELFAELRKSFGVPRTGRKIYVSRFGLNISGRGASRIMVNEAELIARLGAMGFETIEPENLSVKDQILVFSSASIVVGPSGSGLFNTMFCHPGTKVIDIQSEPHWIYSYTGMYSSLRLEYGIFLGNPDPADTSPVHRRFTVNIDALTARVRTFMTETSW